MRKLLPNYFLYIVSVRSSREFRFWWMELTTLADWLTGSRRSGLEFFFFCWEVYKTEQFYTLSSLFHLDDEIGMFKIPIQFNLFSGPCCVFFVVLFADRENGLDSEDWNTIFFLKNCVASFSLAFFSWKVSESSLSFDRSRRLCRADRVSSLSRMCRSEDNG